ncbi:MAG: UMP kinase [Phycisphaerales bacterium]|nr:UMP kinase [Phycisphaerales bacterium]
MATNPFRRVLVKLTGEAMAGEGGLGIDCSHIQRTAAEIASAAKTGGQLVIVPGGGNIVRGGPLSRQGLVSRESADQMGMLGTMINGIALRDALAAQGIGARVLSARAVESMVDVFRTDVAGAALDKGDVVIATGGVGQPYFTTDSGAALRAAQLGCDLIVKATKVDGVYSADPKKDPSAKRLARLAMREAIERRVGIMDLSAMEVCLANSISCAVIDFTQDGTLSALLKGKDVGSIIEA